MLRRNFVVGSLASAFGASAIAAKPAKAQIALTSSTKINIVASSASDVTVNQDTDTATIVYQNQPSLYNDQQGILNETLDCSHGIVTMEGAGGNGVSALADSVPATPVGVNTLRQECKNFGLKPGF